MHRIYYWPKVSSFFLFPKGFLYRRFRNNIWSLVISGHFHKTTNQLWIENSKMTTKILQKLPIKKKLAEENGWKFSYQSGDVIYVSIYLTNRRRSFFFWLPYLEYDFMIANLFRLNLAVLRISETFQDISVVECYVIKVAGSHSLI